MKLKSPYAVKPDSKVKLAKISTTSHHGVEDETASEAILLKRRKQLNDLQEVLYASESKAVLIVLQGMDTAGKDGTIRHIFTGLNPQGCEVASFKVPTPLEARHDFLWRCQRHTPPRGMIGIFNRSHYEQVLSPRVHDKLSHKEVSRSLDDINRWEQTLVDNDVVILKFFLHISQEEQTRRLQARIDDPDKHWKLSAGDFAERRFWPEYVKAYEDILERTSKPEAPWFVIPSDHKWFRNVAISDILVEALKDLDLKYPKPTVDVADLDLSNGLKTKGAAESGTKGKKPSKSARPGKSDTKKGTAAQGQTAAH